LGFARTDPIRLAVIAGSTRPGRQVLQVAEWVVEAASRHDDFEVELIDLADHPLPLLDEEMPAIRGAYANPHTLAWAEAVGSRDAFVFVTPEYNHGPPAALKNALDYLFAEWGDKAAGFVSYGIDAGGARAVEQLRLNVAELSIATVRTGVHLSLLEDFEDGKLTPREFSFSRLETMLGQVAAWASALRELRAANVA
jgi:NAD(P)H-dependent FMN reductase